MRVAGARADFGFSPRDDRAAARRDYRTENLPRLIARARDRLNRLTAEARQRGVKIPEGIDA